MSRIIVINKLVGMHVGVKRSIEGSVYKPLRDQAGRQVDTLSTWSSNSRIDLSLGRVTYHLLWENINRQIDKELFYNEQI